MGAKERRLEGHHGQKVRFAGLARSRVTREAKKKTLVTNGHKYIDLREKVKHSRTIMSKKV